MFTFSSSRFNSISICVLFFLEQAPQGAPLRKVPTNKYVYKWLVRHSFSENGRSVSVYRVALDELAPSQFIWQPYSTATVDALPTYCLTGQRIWRYNSPLICIFIVEHHMIERVMRQFGMVQFIPLDANYSRDLHKITLKGNQVAN